MSIGIPPKRSVRRRRRSGRTAAPKIGLSLRRLVAGLGGQPDSASFTATRIAVVDVEEPTPTLDPGHTPAGTPYRNAEVLVRLHARPLGALTVDLGCGSVPAERLRSLIDQRWGELIRHHLQCDELPPHEGVDLKASAWRGCVLRPGAQPEVSVIVPTYRRPDDLMRCVDSILATGYPRLEVIVVDNAPDDPRTATLVARRYAGDGRVRFLREARPGASRARNLGVRAAGGEIVAFTDDDIVVDPHWLAALTHALATNPDVHCVTGLVIPAALDTPVQQWFERFGGFNRGYQQRLFDLQERRGDTLLYPYTAGGFGGLGNVAFRRAALRRPDAFNVTLGPGGPAFGAEDQDAFIALLRNGGRLLYEPAALVRHRHREEYSDLRWQAFTYGAGQTACFLHWALGDRAVALDMIHRIPRILPLAFGLRGRDGSWRGAVDECRPELRWLERLGYLYGPVAYGRARLWRRRTAVSS
jgi:O-antigen biosynthesis protein